MSSYQIVEAFKNQAIPCQIVGNFKIKGWSYHCGHSFLLIVRRLSMGNMKLYEVTEEYVAFLCSAEKKVFSAKENDRNHSRKYLGIVLHINNYNYYVPLSSPKNTDYKLINGEQKIRSSIVPIIRITSRSASGKLELKGTLKLSNMIPVPETELSLYDVDSEADAFYKSLIYKELHFIRKNQHKILQSAEILYKQKAENNPTIGYLKNTVDFFLLEQKHDEFIAKNE